MNKFKVGDKVKVTCPGLAALRQFAPPGAKPNHHGIVSEILSDTEVMVEFSIGDDDPEEHSQVAPYPVAEVLKR